MTTERFFWCINPSVVFRFADYLFCFRPPNRLFFRLKTISVVSLIRNSDYKSMENISCHSNQSSYPTRIKNTIYVEAYVLSMYAKFQLQPPYDF